MMSADESSLRALVKQRIREKERIGSWEEKVKVGLAQGAGEVEERKTGLQSWARWWWVVKGAPWEKVRRVPQPEETEELTLYVEWEQRHLMDGIKQQALDESMACYLYCCERPVKHGLSLRKTKRHHLFC